MASDIPCKVCGRIASLSFELDNTGGDPPKLDVFICSGCGLLFVGNPVTEAQLARAYGRLDNKSYYQDVEVTTREKAGRALADLAPLLTSGESEQSVLDVGCGFGHFLQGMRQRYPQVRAAGHELPGSAADACVAEGLTVHSCPLDRIPDRFSTVLLLDVAEHVPDPNRVFEGCAVLLKKGGHIYIHTPRRCLWDSIFLRMTAIPVLRGIALCWLHTRVSIYHLQLWTDRALELSLAKAGFRPIYAKAELELSWPLEKYFNLYLGERLNLPRIIVRAMAFLGKQIFVRFGTLKNKAIVLGQMRERASSRED